jgi:hypothetical protein
VFNNLPEDRQNYWLVADPQSGVEACYKDPGYEIDLFAECSLRTMTAIWMGLDTVNRAEIDGRMVLTGRREVVSRMQEWLGLSPFSTVERMAG